MDKTRILAIAPYSGMAELMQSVAKQHEDIDLTVGIGDLETGLQIVRNQDLSNFDIIISRGGTAQLIMDQIPLPVAEVEISVYDVLRAIRMGENFQQRFAIVGYPAITKCAHMLCDLLQYDIEIHTIDGYESTKACIELLKKRGYQHIVCDMVSQRVAIESGVNAILITSGIESIEESFYSAIKLHTYTHRSRLQLEATVMREILKNKHQYTIVYNQGMEIVFSTLGDYEDSSALAEIIQKPIMALAKGEIDCWEYKWKDQRLKLEVIHLNNRAIQYTIITIEIIPITAIYGNHHIQLINKTDETIGSRYLNTVIYLGELTSSVERFCNAAYPLLICGESGCGKSTVAKMLHYKSQYNKKPLYVIDFSIPQNQNIFKLAKNTMSPLHDTKRVIHFKHLECLTTAKLKQCLNYITDSNLILRSFVILSMEIPNENYTAMQHYKIITDMLSCFVVYLKPLRFRTSEIPNLCNLFINQLNSELGKQIIGLEPEGLALMQKFCWPDNLKQMQRILRELMVLSGASYISTDDVAQILYRENPKTFNMQSPQVSSIIDFSKTLNEITCEIVHAVLKEENMNQSRAAKRLGISRSTLWRMLNHDR